jgi:Uma2 family endonuclease
MKTIYKWSVAEYHQMIETGLLAGKPVELLEGEIIEMSPEGIPHSFTNRSVGNYLRQLLQDRALISEAHPITLDNSEPEPDLAIVRLPDTRYATHHPCPEDIYWLIEISDRTLKKDLEEKTITYARNGIAEYWVIDLPHKKLWVFTQPQCERYQNCAELTTEIINPISFPNLDIEVKKLLAIKS